MQVVLGEAPCLATAWVTQYWQLLVLRTLTGGAFCLGGGAGGGGVKWGKGTMKA